MKKTILIIKLIIIMSLLNCNDSGNSSDEVSVNFLKSEFDTGKEFYLLDVRTTPEFYQGRLSFADNLIPYDSLSIHLDKLPQEKDATIYLFCRSGRRSGIATQYLRSLGYTNSYNVSGGIIAWQDAGFSIVSGEL